MKTMTIKTHGPDGLAEIEVPVLYESDNWLVIESREHVPADRYEVRDPAGRRHGIWESIDAAARHLHETKDAPAPVWPEEFRGLFAE